MAKKDQVLGYDIEGLTLAGDVINNAKVRVRYETAEDEHSDPFEMEMVIDFNGIKLTSLLAYAVSPLIIRRQAQERKAGERAALAFYGKTLHYSLLGKKIVSPEQLAEAVDNSVDAMTQEQQERLFARLQARMNQVSSTDDDE